VGNKTIKFRAINHDIFQSIVDGEKKFETRAATPNYIKIKVGDILILVCGNRKVKKKVKKVEHFQTIGALLKKYKPETINPYIHSVREARAMWNSFPNYREKIKRYGLVVWQLEKEK